MDLLISFIKVFVYAYIPVRAIANKEPSSKFFSRIDFRVNRFLHSFKDEKTRNVLRYVREILFKVNIGILVLIILAGFISPSVGASLVTFLGPILAAFAVTVFCINWNMNHREVVRKYFLDAPLVLLPILPLAAAAVEAYGKFPLISAIPALNAFMDASGMGLWPFAASLSAVALVFYMILPYVMFWIVLAPLFYVFMLLTYGMQFVLRVLDRYVATNLMDAVVFIVGGFVVFFF